MSNDKGRRCSADGQVNAVKLPLRGSISSLSSFRFFGSSECINVIKRRIHLLDDRFITMEFTTKTIGRELLREVCSYLNAAESAAYFGIRYVDNNSLPQWLDPERRVMKQIKDLKEDVLSLRVMFYPPNPLKQFKNPDAKHLFYLQLRRDFYVGRLRTNCSATCELAAYAIQADHELTSIPAGFDVVNIPGGMCILPDIPTEVVDLIRYRLKRLLGLSKEQAKDEFIRELVK
ncbi:FERM domain-containing protein 3 [Clonorchis sinensis]|uniref:FERM domain-containing protein 3 n=1 Tax=Clonorchis sinensis TaxID=79923 RepID=A0A8T1MYM9_CLOSI|nr:FERM domain-containing protein 3 [Clonorchis sinensis]